MKKAFTLIELLVVVLIIGILAAVALPQYQKAVKKSYLTQWHTNLNAYTKAIDLWLLANGYPSSGVVMEFSGTGPESGRSFGYLDIDVPCPLAHAMPNKCNTKIGYFHAGCESTGCWANIGSSTDDTFLLENGDHINVTRNSDENVWKLSTVPTSLEARQLVCQYWASAHGVNAMRDEAKTACAVVGVQ